MGGGHSKSRNAFTLIELLAIIVILAIIAVITVPIILNVIDNAKKGSIQDSAYGYKDAVQKFYVSKLYEDANFKFENGTYTVETLKTMGVSVDGKSPTDDSWVEITNNQVTDYSLKFDEWVVNYDNNPEAKKNGTLKSQPPVISWILNYGTREVTYYATSWVKNNGIVKFDPTAGTSGEICTTGDQCYEWYKFGEYTQDGIKYVKLLMKGSYWTGSIGSYYCDGISTQIYSNWKVSASMLSTSEVLNITGASRTIEDGGIKIDWSKFGYYLNPSEGYPGYLDSNYEVNSNGYADTNYSWLYSPSFWTSNSELSRNIGWFVSEYMYMDWATSSKSIRPVITVPASILN